MRDRPVPDSPLGKVAKRIYERYPQYFESPKEVYNMLRWNSFLISEVPEDALGRLLVRRKLRELGLDWRDVPLE